MSGVITGSESAASTIMNSTGQACKVTGFALSATSTLYFANALTATGVAVIEYLPHLVNSTATVGFIDHYASRSPLSWGAIFYLGTALISGILIRKLGSTMTEKENIVKVERFLYSKKEQ